MVLRFEYKKDPKKDKLSDTSVQSYFESKHQILLKYPNAPLLRMHGQKAVYIPFEVLSIFTTTSISWSSQFAVGFKYISDSFTEYSFSILGIRVSLSGQIV